MKITLAKTSGFCFGVKRAIEKVYEILESGDKKVYSIGPLIHNEVVTKDLATKGLNIIDTEKEISELKNEKVVIRTHGVEKKFIDMLTKNGNEIIDLTCPFVKKIHDLVKDYSEKGYKIIIVGDKTHPEVKAIMSYSKTDIEAVLSKEDIEKLKYSPNDKVLCVFQTTSSVSDSQKLVDILNKLFYNIIVENTICNATENRQKEVYALAKSCDAMLIIGSKNSSNTRKLYEIAHSKCKNTFYANSVDELKDIKFDYDELGVSAGASTPEYLIEEIIQNVRT